MYEQNTTKPRKLQAEKRDSLAIHPAQRVRAIVEGRRHREVIFMSRPAKGGVTKKISKDEFIDLRTGELRKFAQNERKQRENLRETFNNLTALIRANFDADNEQRQLFVTLTYAENMTDSARLMVDFSAWYKRLKYHCKGHQLDYIAVAEPQERGAWHMHVMLKSDKTLFIDNKETMQPLWGHGFTDVQRLKSDDVGRYYVAYFTDLFEAYGDNPKKKGKRLSLYPVGMKFYRCSKGIKRPEKADMLYRDVIKQFGEMVGWNTYDIKDADGNVIQTVQREHWMSGGASDGAAARKLEADERKRKAAREQDEAYAEQKRAEAETFDKEERDKRFMLGAVEQLKIEDKPGD